ncbi:MAG: NAD(+)/NADH kinase [Planctomycetes bacterium]|nr:NAD(+)/NADH kinase [Planctomycetota bacterium]
MEKKRVILCGDANLPSVKEALTEIQPLIESYARVVAVIEDRKAELHGIEADVVLVLGGDGALLSTVRRMGADQMPVLGINFGYLGFLTSLAPKEMKKALKKILVAERIPFSERMMLEAEVKYAERGSDKFYALNEIVVSEPRTSLMIRILAEVNGQKIALYYADGLIVATPTGSTAHNLSAGGPIVHPGLDAFVLTPICPHTLNLRPLILPAEEELTLTHQESEREVIMAVDGQVIHPICKSDTLIIRKAPLRFKLVTFGAEDFFERLQSKLRWQGHF